MLKPIQNFSNNNSNTQSSDYVIVGQPSTPDPKSPGSFSK
jgi:hypothetical protein